MIILNIIDGGYQEEESECDGSLFSAQEIIFYRNSTSIFSIRVYIAELLCYLAKKVFAVVNRKAALVASNEPTLN
jgi:hypothetical protein